MFVRVLSSPAHRQAAAQTVSSSCFLRTSVSSAAGDRKLNRLLSTNGEICHNDQGSDSAQAAAPATQQPPTTSRRRRSSAASASAETSAAPRIYTRTGDKGRSSLFTGERRPKSDAIFEALGATDELTSHIGLAMEHARKSGHPYVDQLQRVQCLLQDVGSSVASPASSARDTHLSKTTFSDRHALELEDWIDEAAEQLPPLENFILPGGGLTSAQLHVARAVCRRAERKLATVVQADEVQPSTIKYLNRLSDYLFMAARLAAKLDRKEETIYRRPDETPAAYQSGPDGLWKKSKSLKIALITDHELQ